MALFSDLGTPLSNQNFPSWTVYAQVVDPRKAEASDASIFDSTRVLSEEEFPMTRLEKLR